MSTSPRSCAPQTAAPSSGATSGPKLSPTCSTFICPSAGTATSSRVSGSNTPNSSQNATRRRRPRTSDARRRAAGVSAGTYDDVIRDGCHPRDVASELQGAPALAGRLGAARERDDAPLDLHVEVFDAQPLVTLQLVQHVAL